MDELFDSSGNGGAVAVKHDSMEMWKTYCKYRNID